jgi:hypothetical protein
MHYIICEGWNGEYLISGPHHPEHKEIWLEYHRKWNTVLYAINVKLKLQFRKASVGVPARARCRECERDLFCVKA